MTTLTCPCGSRLNVRGMPPGQRGLCPACGGAIRVPLDPIPGAALVVEDEWNWEGSYGVEESTPPEAAPPVPEPAWDQEEAYGVAAPPLPMRVAKTPPPTVARAAVPDPDPWFPSPLFFPARGMEGLIMVVSLGVTGWVMGTLIPEYGLGLIADGEKLGAPQMGRLVTLITVMPVLFLCPLVVTYWLQYLARVLINAAEGERIPPRPPDRNADGLLSGMGSWLAWLVLGLSVGLVPLAVGFSTGVRAPATLVGLASLGLPYALLALLLSFLHDEDLAARPWKVLGAFACVGPSFLVLCLEFAAILGSAGAPFLLAHALRPEHFWLSILARLPCWLIFIWMTIVAMHTLGSYYHARRDRLRWRRPQAWWNAR